MIPEGNPNNLSDDVNNKDTCECKRAVPGTDSTRSRGALLRVSPDRGRVGARFAASRLLEAVWTYLYLKEAIP